MTETANKRHADDPTWCTCANLRMATRAVTQAFDNALQPTGLKATQFTLLATLEALDDVSVGQLAEALVMDRTTLSRNLKPLVRDGLIAVGHEEDQRVRRLSLTTEGRKTLRTARTHWKRAQTRLVKDLGHQRWSALIDDLVETTAVVRVD